MKDAVLLKLMLLEYSADERFKELAAWHQEQNETPKEVREMEIDGKYPDLWDRPGLRRWIEMEPQLRTVDLSDYFWLARDKLASSLLGLTLVPPVVRNTYNALLSEMGRKSSDSVVAALKDDEVDSLFGLLAKHLQRDPESLDGYRAILKLVEVRPARISQLTALIKELPAEKIPPSFGPQISLLSKAVPNLKNDILEIEAYLSKQAGRAAKAVQLQKR